MKEVDKQPMREGGVKRTPRRTNGTEEGPNTRRIPEAESTKPATYKWSLKSTSARRKRKIAWRRVFVNAAARLDFFAALAGLGQWTSWPNFTIFISSN
jgi:hypothetical protein